LGGNRVSFGRQYLNLVLVFFLCGLWHGASWNFVVWGLFHGTFLVFERIVKIEEILPKIVQHFYAILIVIIGWVFFRSVDLSYALGFLKIMFLGADAAILVTSQISRLLNSHFAWMSFALALLGFSPLFKNFSRHLIRKNKNFGTAIDVFLVAILLLSVIRISAATHNPFIYFQF
jgi:alginate O-acetyltransferase complex protein AlgI